MDKIKYETKAALFRFYGTGLPLFKIINTIQYIIYSEKEGFQIIKIITGTDFSLLQITAKHIKKLYSLPCEIMPAYF